MGKFGASRTSESGVIQQNQVTVLENFSNWDDLGEFFLKLKAQLWLLEGEAEPLHELLMDLLPVLEV